MLPSLNQISQTKEDYLRAMYILEERKGEIKSVDIADYLSVSKPTVNEMIKELAKNQYVTYKKYAPITLTARGKRISSKLTSKHRLIEHFLISTLKINPTKVHEEAHRLEHAFSDESIQKLRLFLGNPRNDPHGKPIPAFGGKKQ